MQPTNPEEFVVIVTNFLIHELSQYLPNILNLIYNYIPKQTGLVIKDSLRISNSL